jgi:CheY-like chemotaxis protein
VEDTGYGMDEMAKARITTQSTQASPKTHSKYGGSRLGLSISQKLVALLGGEFGFDSQQHVGSTFAFYTRASRALPPNSIPSTLNSDTINAEGTTVEHPHAMSTTADVPSTTSPSILLVEDNLINQSVLKKQLQRHGYIVHTANNGQEAFDFIKTTQHWKGATASAVRIDVILMDIEMPIVNGLECANMIRAAQHDGSISKHLHIIAVTANARPEQLKRAKDTGIDDTIQSLFE